MKLGKALAKGYAEETGEEPPGFVREIEDATAPTPVTAVTAPKTDVTAALGTGTAEAAVR
ncbi:hypothetical protein ACFWVC_16420 [Streptomyces sp. NPDC058691]|uniref:hypothetical protein n=1 Tax=Streptomyces sp. NPDC058691 TaxID=3346601 RepID=UPI00365F6811